MHDPIVVVDPDPSWSARYELERERLLAAVEGRFAHLEHIGSTAVPGLAAKPTIDLLAAIERVEIIEEIARRLEPLGYEWRPRIPGDVDIAYFRRIEAGVRTHHLHVVLVESFAGDARRTFRDLLRALPELAAAYAELKRALAQRHTNDRAAYTDAKTELITAALRSAGRDREA